MTETKATNRYSIFGKSDQDGTIVEFLKAVNGTREQLIKAARKYSKEWPWIEVSFLVASGSGYERTEIVFINGQLHPQFQD